jgi:hypothetical protein
VAQVVYVVWFIRFYISHICSVKRHIVNCIFFNIANMPTWNQIQSQLRNPNNPVVFFDISVGTTVSIACGLGLPITHKITK